MTAIARGFAHGPRAGPVRSRDRRDRHRPRRDRRARPGGAVEHYRMVFGRTRSHREEIESDGVREALFAVGSRSCSSSRRPGRTRRSGGSWNGAARACTTSGTACRTWAAALEHLPGHGVELADQHPRPGRGRRRWRSPIPELRAASWSSWSRRRAETVTFSIVARDPGTGSWGSRCRRGGSTSGGGAVGRTRRRRGGHAVVRRDLVRTKGTEAHARRRRRRRSALEGLRGRGRWRPDARAGGHGRRRRARSPCSRGRGCVAEGGGARRATA